MTETAKPAKSARAKADADVAKANQAAADAMQAQHDEKVARQNARFKELGKA